MTTEKWFWCKLEIKKIELEEEVDKQAFSIMNKMLKHE